MTAREPTAEGLAGLSLLLADAWAHNFAGRGGDRAVLDRAREAARRAMDIDGNNLHANVALAFAQFFGGADLSGTAKRILTHWPENAEAQGSIGAMFVLMGDAQRASALVEQAIERTPRLPGGYYASRALVALREQRYADALAAALRIDSPDWPLGQLIVAAAGARGGREDLAARARASRRARAGRRGVAPRAPAPVARRARSGGRARARLSGRADEPVVLAAAAHDE